MAAEEVHINAPAGNGERVELRVGTRALSVSAKDIFSLVTVLGAFAGFYLVSQQLSTNQSKGFAGLAQIIDQNNAHQNTLLEKMNVNQQALLDLVHHNRDRMMAELTAQNHLVHEQTTALRKAVDEQTAEIDRRLAVINYNLGRPPGERIDLELDPAQVPKKDPRR